MIRSGILKAGMLAVAAAGAVAAVAVEDPFPTFRDLFLRPVDPFPEPIEPTAGVVEVAVVEFASLPIVEDFPARMMKMIDVPGAERLFVNDAAGVLYGVSYDGAAVTSWLDLREPRWRLDLGSHRAGSAGKLRFHSFAFHPQFAESDAPGFGRFYTFVDTADGRRGGDFTPGKHPHDKHPHDTVLLEWMSQDPGSAFYDGGPPRELMRIEQPYRIHNGRQIAFKPGAVPGDPDFGLLYLGMGDGGGRWDPLNLSQNLGRVFGKILRIDPLGTNSANGRYGVPADNPFVLDSYALAEIWAYGLRNPENLAWDARTGALLVADIGQLTVEEISVAAPGANLGWDDWEGSFRLVAGWRTVAERMRNYLLWTWSGTWDSHYHYPRTVSLRNPRAAARVTYPVVEFDHLDPLFGGERGENRVAVTGPVIYRHEAIPQLNGRVLFGNLANGETFHVDADDLPDGGQEAIRRVLFSHDGEVKPLSRMIKEGHCAERAGYRQPHVSLRFGTGPAGGLFLLNGCDNVIRRVVAGAARGGAPRQKRDGRDAWGEVGVGGTDRRLVEEPRASRPRADRAVRTGRNVLRCRHGDPHRSGADGGVAGGVRILDRPAERQADRRREHADRRPEHERRCTVRRPEQADR